MTRAKTTRTDATTPNRGWVSFVGSGPGDPELLTVRAVDVIRKAEVVITEQPEHEALVRGLLGLPEPVGDPDTDEAAGPVFVDGGFGEDGQPLTHAARAKVVVRHAKKARVVRLMAGDPFIYASGPEEAQACVKAGLGFEIVPGVSSVHAVPAYAGIPLTTKDKRDVAVVTCGRQGGLEPVRRRRHPGAALRRRIDRRQRQRPDRGRTVPRDAGRHDPGRHDHRPGHRHLDARAHRRRRPRRRGWPRRPSPSWVRW